MNTPEATSSDFFRHITELSLGDLLRKFPDGSQKNAARVYDASSKRTLLHVAAERNDAEKLQWLLDNGANIHSEDSMLRTPLHVAVLANAEKSAEILLNRGADPNRPNKYKAYPIHYAAGAGNEKIVRMLLKFGAKVAVVDRNSSTPLHSAVVTCSTGPIEPLCKHGCDKEAQDRDGSTALHVAARLGNQATPAVAELLSQGCNPNAVDNEGRTPLYRAAAAKSSASVYRLVEAGAEAVDAPTTYVLAQHYPEVLPTVFNKRITAKRYADTPTAPLEKITLDHSSFLKQAATIFDSSSKNITGPYAILKQIANSDTHRSVLAHPLVKTFLFKKWQSARKFAYVNFLFTLVTHLTLTFVGFSTKSPMSETSRDFVVKDVFTATSWLPIAAFTCIGILAAREIISLFTKRADYFRTNKNYLDMAWLASGSIITIDAWQNFTVLNNYSHQVAALTVIIGSFETMIAFGSCSPLLGEYVIIFMVVVKNFIVYSVAYLSLIVGFGLGFHVLFPWKEGFRNAWTSIARAFVMMSGELEFSTAFFENGAEENGSNDGAVSSTKMASLLGPVSMVVFLLFVIVMSVILMNLLIGLTVSDIQALSNQAQSTRFVVMLDTLIETDWLVKATESIMQCCFFCNGSEGKNETKKSSSVASTIGDDEKFKMVMDASPKGSKKYTGDWKRVLEESIKLVEDDECKEAEKATSAMKPNKKDVTNDQLAALDLGKELRDIQSSMEDIKRAIFILDQKSAVATFGNHRLEETINDPSVQKTEGKRSTRPASV